MAVNMAVNYLAVIVSTIAALVIGFVWYAPQVLGKRWMAYLGTTQAVLDNLGPTGMVVGHVAAFVNSWVLALLAVNLGGRPSATGSCSASSPGWASWPRSRPRRSRS